MSSIFSPLKGLLDPQLVALVGAVIAVVGVIVGAVISASIAIIVSRRSSFITAVTTERSKWIDKLRGNIAELLGASSAIRMALPDVNSPEARERREKLDRLIALIQMQLNPDNLIDANMIGLLRLFPDWTEKEKKHYRELELAFVRHAQFLLKAEWERVKFEAMGGILAKCRWRCAAKKRKAAYDYFCTLTQSLVDKIQH